MLADLAQIAYEASLRSLDKQEEAVAELRSRTGLLLATSSLAASLLGERAIGDGSFALVLAALAAFAVSVAASLYVLLPTRDLVFSQKGSSVYEELFEFSHRRLAYALDGVWDANNPRLDRLRSWFRLAVVALGAEVALLLLSGGGTLV